MSNKYELGYDNAILDMIASIIDDEIVPMLNYTKSLKWVEFKWQKENNKRDLAWKHGGSTAPKKR